MRKAITVLITLAMIFSFCIAGAKNSLATNCIYHQVHNENCGYKEGYDDTCHHVCSYCDPSLVRSGHIKVTHSNNNTQLEINSVLKGQQGEDELYFYVKLEKSLLSRMTQPIDEDTKTYPIKTQNNTLIQLEPVLFKTDTSNVYLKYKQTYNTDETFVLDFTDQDQKVKNSTYQLVSASSINELDQSEIYKTSPPKALKTMRAPVSLLSNPTDLKPYITSADIYVNDVKTTGDIKVHENDSLTFKLNYSIPSNVFNGNVNQVYYQIPGVISTHPTNGDVFDSNHNRIGTYSISADGLIVITYTDEFVNEHKGQQVDGFVSFSCRANEIQTDDQDRATIPISQNINIGIEVVDRVSTTNDLKVSKSATLVNPDTGEIKYIITITSENGTSDAVILEDTMSQVSVPNAQWNSFVVKKNGQQVYDSNTQINSNNQFNITLPKMNARDTYTIEYTGCADQSFNTIYPNNRVDVSSKDNNGRDIQDSAQVSTEINHDLLSKESRYNESTDTIHYTITVNQEKRDISGFILTDVMSYDKDGQNIPIDGVRNVTLRDERGQVINIQLPYTFPPGSNQKYTIEYDYEVQRPELENHTIKNQANLRSPTSGEVTKETYNYIGPQVAPPSPVKKSANGVQLNEDQVSATLKWNVTIQTQTAGKLTAPWVFSEVLGPGQYMTDQQYQDAKREFIQKMGWNNISESDMTFVEQYDSQRRIVGFNVQVRRTLDANTWVDIPIESTADVDASQSASFNNKAYVNDSKAEASQNYDGIPTLKKYDLVNGSTDDTQHEYYDENLEEPGVIAWGIEVNIPVEYQHEDVTITENLPEGVTLKQLQMAINNLFDFDTCPVENGTTTTLTKNGQNIQFYQDGQTITITLPKEYVEMIRGNTIKLKISTSIDDDVDFGSDSTKSFQNKVSLEDKDHREIDNTTQTQKIINDIGHGSLDKKVDENTENELNYSITVNKDGRDLVKNSDTLELTDIMKHNHNIYYLASSALKPNSVKVYEMVNGEKGRQLESDEFSYTYEEVIDQNNGNPTKKNILNFKVPDEKPLIIEYCYILSSGTSSSVWTDFNNTIKIDNVTSIESESSTNSHKEIVKSSAGADANGIQIQKVDEDNNGLGLQGAKFELYRWDNATRNYVPVLDENNNKKVFVSGDKGRLLLAPLEYNTAYKLIEIEAPDGYKVSSDPIEFVIRNQNVNTSAIPDNYKGENKAMGDYLYFKNKKTVTEIKVTKAWHNTSGQDTQAPTDRIQFTLYKKYTINGNETNEAVGDYEINSKDNWTKTIDKLPLTGTVNGVEVEYTYYVKEKEVESYETTYVNNDGVSQGMIQIINTKKLVLPETGKQGIEKYFIIGLLFMVLSIIFLLFKKLSDKGGDLV